MSLTHTARPRLVYAAIAFLVCAALFGGASRHEVPGWIVVNAAALGAAAFLIWTMPRGELRLDRSAFWLMAAMVAIPLLQLVPLPYALWSNLPGRALEVEAFRVIGLSGWLPISAAPARTLLAALSLIAPICAFVIASQLDRAGRMYLATAVTVLACASALLGVVQIVDGDDSSLRLYRITAADAAVGLFSNPNHQATFLMCAIPLVVVALVDRLPQRGAPPAGLIAAALATVALLATGMMLTWSRAGILFCAISITGSIVLLPNLLPGGQRRLITQRRMLAAVGVLVCALAATVMVALGARGAADAVRDQGGARIDNVPHLIRIAIDYLPFGSGLGSFDPVYRTYETLTTLSPSYLNQAHNEPAQIFIEAGVAGLLLMVGFLVWWARWAFDAWSAGEQDQAGLLRRAAALSASLFLIHSIVDYPLRTPSGAVVFAILCALMLPARPRPYRNDERSFQKR